MLASSGSTFTSDDDPELWRRRSPLDWKLYEGLLAESPKHSGLLFAASQGFAEFSYAFVDAKIDEIRGQNLEEANALRERARKLYRRPMDMRCAALKHGIRALPKHWTTTQRRR